MRGKKAKALRRAKTAEHAKVPSNVTASTPRNIVLGRVHRMRGIVSESGKANNLTRRARKVRAEKARHEGEAKKAAWAAELAKVRQAKIVSPS